ncbi:MAG: hypothetical protein PF693_12375 [Spirochaetia bacterium]|jgi:hypothetical protein|nr:hypothetical protein [Spirochaetia bacterium]
MKGKKLLFGIEEGIKTIRLSAVRKEKKKVDRLLAVREDRIKMTALIAFSLPPVVYTICISGKDNQSVL